ncbi:MAG TPA: hypothetical protein VNJ02_04910 [Vicinamibacterales bacterium]|nr:hypothetical protein [Vicinamibacterales bacterium]
MSAPPSQEQIRVAYITCDAAEWYEFAARMRRSRGWKPVYWICETGRSDYLERRFPGVIPHSRYHAYHLEQPPKLAHVTPRPLDTAILEQYREAELVAMKMMDVMDSVDAFDFNARRRFFYQRLAYWDAVMNEVRPDVCMFTVSAHAIYDYIIYVWCRLNGVRTIMFEQTFNFSLWMPLEDPLVGSTEISDRYADLLKAGAHEQPIDLPDYCEAYLDRLKGKYGAVPWYMRDQFKSMPKEIAKTLYKGEDAAAGTWDWQRLVRDSKQALHFWRKRDGS